MAKKPVEWEPEPVWPASLGVLAVGGLFLTLPDHFLPGPNWLPLVAIVGLLAPMFIFRKSFHAKWYHTLSLVVSFLVTVALIWAWISLLRTLPGRKEMALELLRSAGALWFCNLLVFASWYWKLDAGGPHERYMRGKHREGAFLFPQMQQEEDTERWRPEFVDYLFLAFNTSTALSPTDTMALSRPAKLAMMAQSLISLSTIVIIAGRAVNIL